ncbi:MAG: transcription antitermination factor NusB [Nitrospirota bacterium]
MGRRRKAREIALQVLYQIDIRQEKLTEEFLDEALYDCKNISINDEMAEYSKKLIRGIMENLTSIDDIIAHFAANWRIDRMAVVDRNILRIAVYELKYRDDIPSKVAINEAIEIAKRYSTEDSGTFINGILDGVARSLKEHRTQNTEHRTKIEIRHHI